MRLILSLLLALSLPAFAQNAHGAPKAAAMQAAPLSDVLVKKIDKPAPHRREPVSSSLHFLDSGLRRNDKPRFIQCFLNGNTRPAAG